jgi:hypothetical protein
VSAAMVLILLIGTLQGSLRSAQLELNNDQLSKLQGGQSFWKDPCTLDGFVFGLGSIGCMAGNIFSCMGAVGGFVKAWKSDDCF